MATVVARTSGPSIHTGAVTVPASRPMKGSAASGAGSAGGSSHCGKPSHERTATHEASTSNAGTRPGG